MHNLKIHIILNCYSACDEFYVIFYVCGMVKKHFALSICFITNANYIDVIKYVLLRLNLFVDSMHAILWKIALL